MRNKHGSGRPGKRRIDSAADILYRRYVKGKPGRVASFRETFAEMSLGEYIRELRERQELTQQQLADAIGTKRSCISRLESADYEGHSIDMLIRIATALHGRLIVRIDIPAAKNEQGQDGEHEARELVLSGK